MQSGEPYLLTLPTELRLQILRWALKHPYSDERAFNTTEFPTHRPVVWLWINKREREQQSTETLIYHGTSLCSPIFLINKQIHDEVESVICREFMWFFGQRNGVSLEDAAADQSRFLTTISSSARSQLRNVHLEFNIGFEEDGSVAPHSLIGTQERWSQLLRNVPNLKEIHLRFCIGCLWGTHNSGGHYPDEMIQRAADMVMVPISVWKNREKVTLEFEDAAYSHTQCTPSQIKIHKECIRRIAIGAWCDLADEAALKDKAAGSSGKASLRQYQRQRLTNSSQRPKL